MKDTIYLIVDQRGVQSMRKSFTGTKRGEVCIKLNVEVEKKAFEPPVLEQSVYVADWRDNVDIEDVQFNRNVITQEEAEMVKQKRIEKMATILESQGFTITRAESEQE